MPRRYRTLRITTDESECKVVFEPWADEYVLTRQDELLIHVRGRARRVEDADIEVVHGGRQIALWLPDGFRVWNNAGEELRI